MERIKSVLLIILIGCSLSGILKAAGPVKIIFDTDMGPDYDDVGAITVLHGLAANGECDILACCSSDRDKSSAPTIEAFNLYFQADGIPVGAAVKDAPDFPVKNHWSDSIVARFLPVPKTGEDYPSAVDVYRKALAAQDDQSVTIVTVGFTSNLAALLKSKPDDVSPLPGIELVKQKVIKWVAMAGGSPQGKEFNVLIDSTASYYAFQNWPTPILFSGFEIGAWIKTGDKVATHGTIGSPVQWTYQYCLSTYTDKREVNHPSWDQTAVLCAIRDPEKYFYVNGPGRFVIHRDGSNVWDPDTNTHHYFLVHKYPYRHIADILDKLMMYEP